MSPDRVLPVTLSARARLDFIDILRFTGETWGQAQLLAYRDKFDHALQLLACHPQLGQRRDDPPPTHRAYLVGSSVVVYRIRANDLAVVRILHQRMSLRNHV